MSDGTEAAAALMTLGGGCLAAAFAIAWCLVLPTVGFLYMTGYLR